MIQCSLCLARCRIRAGSVLLGDGDESFEMVLADDDQLAFACVVDGAYMSVCF